MTSDPETRGVNPHARAVASNGWLTPHRFAALLALLIFAVFWQVILSWQTFYIRDFAFFGYPLAHYHRESFWHGEVPLWNPLNNCGLPFLAQWNTLVLYPGSLFYLLFPLSWSLAVFCLLHQFLAGIGIYHLARYLTHHRLAAAIAGLAFAFNGLTLNCLMWPNNIAALGWMPWVVLASQRACQEGGRKIAVAIIIGGMQMLAGAPEVIALTWVAAAALAGSRMLTCFHQVARIAGRFFMLIVSVAALSSAQLLPFYDLLKHAHRDLDFGDSAWAMPGWGWASFLVPLFRCFRGFHGVYWQQGQYWTSSYYPGVAIVALSVIAVALVRRRSTYALAFLALTGFVLALGDNGILFGWLRQVVPQIGFMRFPIKFVVLVSFTLPLLAAHAVPHFQNATVEPKQRCWFLAAALCVLLIVVIGGILWFARWHPEHNEDWALTCRNGIERALFLLLISGSLCALRNLKHGRSKTLGELALLLLIASDSLTHAPQQNPVVARKVYEPGLVRLSPQPRPGEGRAMVSPEGYLKLLKYATTNAFNDCVCDRLGLFADCNLLDGIPKVDGFYSLYLRESEAIRRFLYDSTNAPPAPLCDFLSVQQFTDPDNFLEWKFRPTFLPPATVGQKPVFADETAIFNAITNPNFDPRRMVYLPLAAQPLIQAGDGSVGKILGATFQSQHVRIELQTGDNTLLVIAQNDYPPWHALVDGQPERIWRANFAFQAVALPAGRHDVTLSYVDSNFIIGVALSVLTATGCLILLFAKPGNPVIRV